MSDPADPIDSADADPAEAAPAAPPSGLVPDLHVAGEAAMAPPSAVPPLGAPQPQAAASPPPRGPLGTLALAFSGGGYRAAGFHLGVLRLLDRVGLLNSVGAVSTVSGGTIVGAAWVVSLLEKRPFADFDRGFATFLRRTNVIHAALEDLTGTRDEHDSPTLIRSAAHVYARPDFLGDRRFSEILEADQLPLDEVIFNSTEFHSGVDFRFRSSINRNAVIGNGNFRVPPEVAANIRLADVTAASSCFPSGFEPFLFPDHFHWPSSFPLQTARDALGPAFQGGLPLMDGGIYDNQGIGSLVLAYEKAADPPVLLISDTTQPYGDLYTYPKAKGRGWLTLRMVNVLGWIVFLLALISTVGLALNLWDARHALTLRYALVYGFALALSLGVAVGMLWLRRKAMEVGKILKSDVRIDDAWEDLQRLTVVELITLVQLRVTSLIALTSSIFMKRVRSLIFSSVYADERYRGKRVPTLIYTLTQNQPTLFEREPWLRPGDRLRALSDRACEVPTALWLTSDAQLDLLADTGEATACFSLLKHVLELPPERRQDPAVASTFDRLRQVWTELNR